MWDTSEGKQALAAPERAGCYALPVSEGILTKVALVEEVADVAGLPKKRTEIIVETVFGSSNRTGPLEWPDEIGPCVGVRGWK